MDVTAWNERFRRFCVFKKPFCMARAWAVFTTWGSCLQRHPMTCPHPNPAPHHAKRLGHLSGPSEQLSGRTWMPTAAHWHRGSGARNYISYNALTRGNDSNYTYQKFVLVDETYLPHAGCFSDRTFVRGAPDLVIHMPSRRIVECDLG